MAVTERAPHYRCSGAPATEMTAGAAAAKLDGFGSTNVARDTPA